MRVELKVKNWRSYLPIWDTLARYRRDDFDHDLIAGLILGVITVPQAIAYAFLAGLPAQAGLYACLVPMLLYAMLGSSKHLVVGPVAIAALMVASAVGEYAPLYSDAYLALQRCCRCRLACSCGSCGCRRWAASPTSSVTR